MNTLQSMANDLLTSDGKVASAESKLLSAPKKYSSCEGAELRHAHGLRADVEIYFGNH